MDTAMQLRYCVVYQLRNTLISIYFGFQVYFRNIVFRSSVRVYLPSSLKRPSSNICWNYLAIYLVLVHRLRGVYLPYSLESPSWISNFRFQLALFLIGILFLSNLSAEIHLYAGKITMHGYMIEVQANDNVDPWYIYQRLSMGL